MTRIIPYLPHYVSQSQFFGGQSSDEAIGTPASFSYSRALDHRTNPSQLTVLPGPRKIGVANDLILNVIQTKSGARYAFGDQGNVYKIANDNTFTFVNKLITGSDGALFKSDSDACYFATQTDVRRYYPMSGTPTFDVTYGVSKSIGTNSYRTGGTSTNYYPVPLSLTENEAGYFEPDIEPFYSIKLNITTKGTGDLTLTLHDGLNHVLATSTVLAANVTTGQVEFVFSSQIRALVKPNARTYHYHLTSTVNDTRLYATIGTLQTSDFELWAYRLVQPNNGFHPMAQFEQFILIGNGRYLAVWEPLTDNDPPNNEFQRHRLTFPDGFEVCGIAVTDEFAVIACEKYSTDGTKDFQEGKLFLWDGTATTYNQIIDVSGGSPGAIQSHENYPYFFVQGALCAWPGGKNITKIRSIANTNTVYSDTVDNTRIYPNMMCIRQNLLHAGYPSITNNASIEHGVYVWGSLEKNYPPSFNFGYVPSSMQVTDTGTSLQIGCVRNFGDEMYISWKDATGAYGLDIVDNLCDPAPIFKYRARRFDAGEGYSQKQLTRMSLSTSAISATTAIKMTHNIDAAGDVQHEVVPIGSKYYVSTVQLGTFFRLVAGFDGTTTDTASPKIYVHTFEYQPNADRRKL